MLLKTSHFLLSLENEVYKGYTPCSGCDNLCHSLASGLTVVRAKQGTLACLPRSLEAILRNCKSGAAPIVKIVKHFKNTCFILQRVYTNNVEREKETPSEVMLHG